MISKGLVELFNASIQKIGYSAYKRNTFKSTKITEP